MVKRREPKASGLKQIKSEPTKEQIEAFASRAEGGEGAVEPIVKKLDQNANRDYKAMSVPFNEYEFEQLTKGAKLSGRSKLNFMRYAMLKLTKELEKETSD